MKLFLHLVLLAMSVLFFAPHEGNAQTVDPGRKPPKGVPTDALYFNGKWYHLFLEHVSWTTARAKCTTLGGQLAVIPDEATWNFVKKMTLNAYCWLGASDEKTTGLWKWIDGTPFHFSAWDQYQPDNKDGKEHYLHAGFGKDGGWNDAPRDGRMGPRRIVGYVCEWKDAP